MRSLLVDFRAAWYDRLISMPNAVASNDPPRLWRGELGPSIASEACICVIWNQRFEAEIQVFAVTAHVANADFFPHLGGVDVLEIGWLRPMRDFVKVSMLLFG